MTALVRKPLDMKELLGKIGIAAAHIIQQYEINSLSSGLAASITAQLEMYEKSTIPSLPPSKTII